ncbi:hypothetical protein [Burkholderia ambifaria]|uniref:hypothetical protein n=1 Tax=Burkholderia ambifaria TaxID=152480 RepID=UPI000F810F57|nr:hypothetical protein [Burkholderia ambifaria]
MFELITGAINLLGWSAAMAFTVTLHLSQTYHPNVNLNDADTVTAFQAYKGGMWYTSCTAEGVMLPYARDWEETVQRGREEVVLPPEPDTTVGQAYIVTKMKCKDKPEEHVLLVDQDYRAVTRIAEDHTLTAQAYFGLKPDQRPKWFGQVIKRLERAAATNPSAKQALKDIATYEQQLKAETTAAASGASAASAPVAGSEPAAAAQAKQD